MQILIIRVEKYSFTISIAGYSPCVGPSVSPSFCLSVPPLLFWRFGILRVVFTSLLLPNHVWLMQSSIRHLLLPLPIKLLPLPNPETDALSFIRPCYTSMSEKSKFYLFLGGFCPLFTPLVRPHGGPHLISDPLYTHTLILSSDFLVKLKSIGSNKYKILFKLIFFLMFWKPPPFLISAYRKIRVTKFSEMKDFFLFKSQKNMSGRHLSRGLGHWEHFLQYSRCLLYNFDHPLFLNE